MPAERLQKVLARAGLASRRACEEMIAAGRVRVDGKRVSELGTRVDPRARIEVDGKVVEPERFVYLIVNKPRGVICTMKDPEGRPTVAQLIDTVRARVVPVGRLDYNTSGALLMTNDGDFAAGLAHPRRKVEKVYVAKVQGTVDKDALERWQERIVIDGVRTQPAAVRFLRHEAGKTWLQLTLTEGKNRQIHRLGEHTGHAVMRLARQSIAGLTTEGLRAGQWRYLTVDELKSLKKAFGVPRKVAAPTPDAAPRARSTHSRGLGGRHTTTQRGSAGTSAKPSRGEAPRRGRAAKRSVR